MGNYQWKYPPYCYPYPPVIYQQVRTSDNFSPFIQKLPKDSNDQINGNTTVKNSVLDNESLSSNIVEDILKKLNEIEEENKKLKEEISNIKPVTIENVNYKIQELSVQELSGTLLVGLTALSDAEELKKLLSEKGPVKINDMDTEDMAESEEESSDTN